MLTALLLAANGAFAQADTFPDTHALPHAETLRVVYNVAPPYIIVNSDGEPDGFAVEVLRHAAAHADLALTFQRVANVDEALAMIEAGDADLHPGMVPNAERRKVVAYTSPIKVTTLSLYALAHRAPELRQNGLNGQRVGYHLGTAGQSAAQTIFGAELVGLPQSRSLLEAITEEELDLGVYVDSAVERQVRMTGMGGLVARVGPPLQVIAVGIAVSNRLPEQLARLDSALLQLKAEAAFDDITDRWFGPPKSWWTIQRLFFAYLGGIAVVVLIALGAYSRLRRAFRRGLNRETRLRAALARRHAAMLEQKNAQLAAQNDEMQRLLQAVSHDLKSPMVTVRGFAGVLEDAMASGDQDLARDACRRIVVSTGHLSGITDGLQEFNRVDQKPIALRELDLAALIAEAEEMLSADIADADARIVVAPALPNVRADESQLLRVLLNLILNALRHGCPEPGMTIEISAAKGDQVTEIVVRDHGPGVPEAFQRDVFRLFRRLAPGQADGTGIGLSIVARVAAKHGGSAWITSPEGGGAAVHLTLLNHADAQPSPPRDEGAPTTESAT